MKKFFQLSLCALLFLAFTACNETKPADENKEGKQTENKQETQAPQGPEAAILTGVDIWKIDPDFIENELKPQLQKVPQMAEFLDDMILVLISTRISFKADGTTVMSSGEEKQEGKWAIEGKTISLTDAEGKVSKMEVISAEAKRVELQEQNVPSPMSFIPAS